MVRKMTPRHRRACGAVWQAGPSSSRRGFTPVHAKDFQGRCWRPGDTFLRSARHCRQRRTPRRHAPKGQALSWQAAVHQSEHAEHHFSQQVRSKAPWTEEKSSCA